MECKDADYVLAVATYGSFSKAADMLHISQPALSKYIKFLEEREGIRLFDRESGRLTPTEAGLIYIQHAEQISSVKKDLASRLNSLRNSLPGTIRLACASNGASSRLSKAVECVRSKYPGTEIYVSEVSSSVIEEMLLSGDLDAGFISAPINHELESEFICDEYVLVGIPKDDELNSHAYVEAGCPYKKIDIKLLQGRPYSTQPVTARLRIVTDELLSENKVTMNPVLIGRDKMSSMLAACSNNSYFFTTDKFLYGKGLPTAYNFYAVGTPAAKISVYMVTRRNINRSPEIKLLVQSLKKLLNNFPG